MNKETLRMQMLVGIITEGQYKAKLNENVTYMGKTEDMPFREKIFVNDQPYLTAETSQEEQQEIANFLKSPQIDKMYEPNQFAEILGYNSVQDLAVAIAEKYGVELTVDLNESSRLYREGDNIFNIIDQEIIIPDQNSNYDNNDTEDEDGTNLGIGFPTQKVGKDYTADQKQKFIDYLKNKADKGNEKAIELYKIAQTDPESEEFITDPESEEFI